MSIWSIGLAFVLLLLLVAAFVMARTFYVGTRPGAFRTMLLPPQSSHWHRGYARYGTESLTWSPLFGLSWAPVLVLRRRDLRLTVVQPDQTDSGTVVLRMSAGGPDYLVVLGTGDYAGMVSWADSTPPREPPLR